MIKLNDCDHDDDDGVKFLLYFYFGFDCSDKQSKHTTPLFTLARQSIVFLWISWRIWLSGITSCLDGSLIVMSQQGKALKQLVLKTYLFRSLYLAKPVCV